MTAGKGEAHRPHESPVYSCSLSSPLLSFPFASHPYSLASTSAEQRDDRSLSSVDQILKANVRCSDCVCVGMSEVMSMQKEQTRAGMDNEGANARQCLIQQPIILSKTHRQRHERRVSRSITCFSITQRRETTDRRVRVISVLNSVFHHSWLCVCCVCLSAKHRRIFSLASHVCVSGSRVPRAGFTAHFCTHNRRSLETQTSSTSD